NYKINLIVNNENLKGAPIIFEDNPTYSNLICSIEHDNEQGLLKTNFNLIKSGSLHKANGGYLVINAKKIKKNKDAWEALKLALFNEEINIEVPEYSSEQAKPVSLEPYPIKLKVKIILIGERYVLKSLANTDHDFGELFKVCVDFDDTIHRNKSNIILYSKMIANIINKLSLKPFNCHAIAELIEFSSRTAEDKEKLSTHISLLKNLIIESDYFANLKKSKIVKKEHVDDAHNYQIERVNRIRDLYYEDICRDFVVIKTKGKIVGQINGLSVVTTHKLSYGHPSRITAIVRAGRNNIVDIQRKIKLAGPSFVKGGIIISNFIAGRYDIGNTLSLFASFSFEQMYDEIDGDSASIAEVCALLSALSECPIRQDLAVTGSMDQYGRVQAVGGINEKIEGFYDICKLKGFNGSQGVIIPSVNIKNLMLREDIVNAVQKKIFFIYKITTIDEAIELLTGYVSGIKINGKFTKNSINEKVENKLISFNKNN
ncbi:AAA family ATPase, partial [Gammaproteobacteria bacterium]|nr:AAA family ATPase [Gammaproteobacteria bacterium]